MVFLRQLVVLITLLGSIFSRAQEIDVPTGEYEFFQNKGQWPNGVLYRAELQAGNIWLEQGRILYHFTDFSELHENHANHSNKQEVDDALTFKQDVITANFIGANTEVLTETKYPTSDYQNYFLGNNSDHWASEVYGYHHVKYKSLYQGIDMLFFEKESDLKYEFHVKPNADPNQIKIEYKGHEKIDLEPNGNLKIFSPLGIIQENKPFAYQIKNGRVIEIDCSFQLQENTLTFNLGFYDEDLELIIDPELIFATFCGSTSDNFGMTATFANDGKGYSAGIVYGNTYPTPGPAWNTTTNITVPDVGTVTTDVFVSKYSEDGTTMLWTNFIGGGDNMQGTETVHSLIADEDDNIYLYGATSSTDFPIEGGFQTEHGGGEMLLITFNGTNFGSTGTDIYIAKFSSDGLDLLGSTYVGGSGNDGVNYKLSSGTYSSAAAYDSLTTNYGDQFRGEIMLDSLNNIYVASSSWSPNFPTEDPFQAANGGNQDAVIFKIESDFSSLIWSSYFGGEENDAGYTVKLDSSYNVLIGGGTTSEDLEGTIGGLQEAYGGGRADGFLAKIAEDGSLIQSTYIGTDSYDQVFFIEVDRFDNVYIVGQSLGTMPVSTDVYSNPGSTQFIWKINSDLNATEFTTVFGNGLPQINISPSAFLVDVCGNIYVSGWGGGILPGDPLTMGMPTTSDAFQTDSPNGRDFYMIVFEREAKSLLYGTYVGGAVSDEHVDGGTSRFDKFGVVYQSVCGGCGGNSDFPTTAGAWSADNLSPNCNNLLYKFDFEIVPVAKFDVDLLEGCAPLTLTFANESNDTTNFEWEFGPGTEVLVDAASPVVLFEEPGVYEVILTVTDTICNLTDTAVRIITVHEQLDLEVPNDTIVCSDLTYDITANSNGTATEFTWSEDPDFGIILNDGALDSTISVSPITTTTYYVTATNGNPICDLIDSVTVIFVAGGIEVLGDTTICVGDTTAVLAENIIPEIDVTFDWSPNEFITFESDGAAIVVPPSSMYFYVIATTDMGCVIQDSVWVQVNSIDPSSVFATATPDLVPEGGSSVLEAFPEGYSYTWEPNEGLSDPNERITNAIVNETTEYTVSITDGICEERTPITVTTYEFVCGDVFIFVPNAFSPNDDNQNDILFVRGENLEEITFKVFNRWGELVFESTDQSLGWDGTFKGKAVDPDVYVYHLQVICFDGQENLVKGNITLLR